MVRCGSALKINDSGGRARIVPVFIPSRAALENVDDPIAVRWKLLPEKENAHRFVFALVSSGKPLLQSSNAFTINQSRILVASNIF